MINFSEKNIQKQKEAYAKKKRRPQEFFTSWIMRIVLIAAVLVILIAAVGVIRYTRALIRSTPSLTELEEESENVTKILDSDGNVIDQFSASSESYVALEQIPEAVRDAFITAVDPTFYSNSGTDVQSLIRTLVRGDGADSGATITELLIRGNIYGWSSYGGSDNFTHRLQEEYLANRLEQSETKDWILEHYLNNVNLGEGCYGVSAAAQRYFGKNISELTVSEGAVLAAIAGDPEDSDPLNSEEAQDKNAQTREEILDEMTELGYLEEEELSSIKQDDVYSRLQAVSASGESSEDSDKTDFSLAVKEAVISDLMTQLGYSREEAEDLFSKGGLTIDSTMDADTQQACRETVAEQLTAVEDLNYSVRYSLSVRTAEGTVENYTQEDLLAYLQEEDEDAQNLFSSKNKAKKAIQSFRNSVLKNGAQKCGESIYYIAEPQISVTVVEPGTGYVRALIGTSGKDGAVVTGEDRTQTLHGAGNMTDVLTAYAAALESGSYTLASTATGETGEQAVSENADTAEGMILFDAIDTENHDTANTLLREISSETVYQTASRFGLSQLSSTDDLLVGSDALSISNMELAAAYTALASNGRYISPVYYTEVRDRNGNVILSSNTASTYAVKDSTAYLLTQAMQGEEESYYATQSCVTENKTDSWFAGYSTDDVCVVWVGNENGSALKQTELSEAVWTDIMDCLADDDLSDFDMPDSVTASLICALSGDNAMVGVCPDTQIEYYADGTEPQGNCTLHQTAIICAESGLLAGEECPKSSREKKVFVQDSEDPEEQMPTRTCDVHGE